MERPFTWEKSETFGLSEEWFCQIQTYDCVIMKLEQGYIGRLDGCAAAGPPRETFREAEIDILNYVLSEFRDWADVVELQIATAE